MGIGSIGKKLTSNLPVGQNANIPVNRGGIPFVPHYHDEAKKVASHSVGSSSISSGGFRLVGGPNSRSSTRTSSTVDAAGMGTPTYAQYGSPQLNPNVDFDLGGAGSTAASAGRMYNTPVGPNRGTTRGGAYKGSLTGGSNVSSPAAAADNSVNAQSWMGRQYDKVIDAAKFSEGPAIPAFSFDKAAGVKGNVSANFGATKEWFGSGTRGDTAKKIGYTAAAYGAANMGGRALTGGGATYNADGRRDIAGIPFV